MPTFASSRPLHHRVLAVLLLVALVLAQTLGWMHRSLHGAGDRAGGVQALLPAEAAPPAAQAPAHWTSDLFGGHAEASDCRLYDLLGQGGCPPAAQSVLPPVAPAAWLALSLADFVARWAALFDARGPPILR